MAPHFVSDLIDSALGQMKTILARRSIEKKPMKTVQTPNVTSSVADDSIMKHQQQQIDALLLENARWKSECHALAQRFLTVQASPSSRSSHEQPKTCEIDAVDRQYHETIVKQKEAQLDAQKAAYRELQNVCEQHESQREALERAVTRCQFDREELMDDVADLKAELKTTNAQNQQLAACIMKMETLFKQRTDEKKRCEQTKPNEEALVDTLPVEFTRSVNATTIKKAKNKQATVSKKVDRASLTTESVNSPSKTVLIFG
ncbi:hypothetical protein FI667_g1060, partial [Globisporangium splendens]